MSETSAGSTARHQAAVQAQAVDEAPRTKKKAGTKRAAKSAPHSPPTDWSALARQYAIEYKTGVAASIGASVSAVVGFPLDSVKTRMQAYKYSSIPQCVVDTYKNEGSAGFFRGMSIPLVTITLVRTTSFSIYEASKSFFGHLLHHPLYKSPIQTQREQLDKPLLTTSPPYHGFFGTNASVAFLAGATSGSFITLLSCPFEFTKMATQIELLLRRTRLAGDPSVSYEPKTPMKMAKDIYFGRGFLGLYSGFGYHLGRDAMGTGIYFGSYESSKYLLSNIAPPGPWTYAASGALCGIVAWCVVFPIDTAKSIVQRDILIHEPGVLYRKKNLWDFNWMSRRMYRGMSVSIMRSAIVNAINFTLYEGVRKKITAWEQESSSTIGL